MIFRLYQAGDFAPLYAIEESCFDPPLRFPRDYMRSLVESSNAAAWIAQELAAEGSGGGMAGFAIVEWTHKAGGATAYIQTLEVAPGARRRGIGGELLRRLESSAQSAGAQLIWLHVDAENTSAIHLYESRGYEHKGREENYYARSRAALVYAKALAARIHESSISDLDR